MSSAVKLTRYRKSIPTYDIISDEKYPVFRTWSNLRCYPYAFRDHFSSIKRDRQYLVLALENRYLKVELCPDLGGRILSAVYKPTNAPLFYTNPVVKPSLISLNGAWIVTGVEFNCPYYGHSPTGIYPVHHGSGTRKDGSAWVKTGFHDRLYGIQWEVTVALHPDSTAIETEYRILNPNPVSRPCYLWINAAVKADPSSILFLPVNHIRDQSFQVFYFPRDRETGRAFDRFDSFPVDIDLYGLDAHDEAFGYYDPANKFGIVHWSPANHFKGKKFFTWGTGKWSQTWAKALTDTNDIYYEIQAGMCETQTDFRYIRPGEQIKLKSKWFPIPGLGPILCAGQNIAISLTDNKMRIVACKQLEDIKVLIRTKKTQRKFGCDLEPGIPVEIDIGIQADSISEISAYHKKGMKLAAWKKPPRRTKKPCRTTRHFPNPKTAEQYCSAGLELELKDDRPGAEKHFSRALQLRPAHAKSLLAQSRIYYLQGRYAGALALLKRCHPVAADKNEFKLLRKAIERNLGNSILPHKSGAPLNGTLNLYNDIQSFMNAAVVQMDSGNYGNGLKILEAGEDTPPALGESRIEYLYYLGYAAAMAGKTDRSRRALEKAKSCNPDQAFPYRLFTEKVLMWTISVNPDSALAHYLLGNLYMGWERKEDALPHWEKAVTMGFKYSVLERNIGLAKSQIPAKIHEAEQHYRNALFLDPGSQRIFLELHDLLCRQKPAEIHAARCEEYLNEHDDGFPREKDFDPVPPLERARELLMAAPVTFQNSGAIRQREAEHLLRDRKYAEAAGKFKNTHFQLTEWRQGLLELFRDIHLAWAIDLLKTGCRSEAVKVLYQSADLPQELQLKDETPLSNAPSYYLLLLAGESKDWAGKDIHDLILSYPCYFEVLVDVKYYHAYARILELTNEPAKARETYRAMKIFAECNLVNYPGMSDWWEPLLAGSYKGLGKTKEAEKRFNKCLARHSFPLFQLELDLIRNPELLKSTDNK